MHSKTPLLGVRKAVTFGPSSVDVEGISDAVSPARGIAQSLSSSSDQSFCSSRLSILGRIFPTPTIPTTGLAILGAGERLSFFLYFVMKFANLKQRKESRMN